MNFITAFELQNNSTIDYLSDKVSFANFINIVSINLKKFPNCHPFWDTLFRYTSFIVHSLSSEYIVYRAIKVFARAYKLKGPSVSKVLSQLLIAINFKQYTSFVIESCSIVALACRCFFPIGLLSCKWYQKTQSNIAMSVIKTVTEFFSFRRTDRCISEIPDKET